jgi:hypothetical protein
LEESLPQQTFLIILHRRQQAWWILWKQQAWWILWKQQALQVQKHQSDMRKQSSIPTEQEDESKSDGLLPKRKMI